MSGILDNKTRVLDVFLTQEGKRQLSSGDLKIEYVSFTDSGTYYSADLVSGSTDATSRIFFEACNLPQDQITFEADDSGMLRPFRNSENIHIQNGQIMTHDMDVSSDLITGSIENVQVVNGSVFASLSDKLLLSSTDNYQKLQTLASVDRIFDDDGFGVSSNTLTFVLNDKKPLPDNRHDLNLDHLDGLFSDVKLSHIPNFKYLPPINKLDDSNNKKLLGNYRPLGQRKSPSFAQLKIELNSYERAGLSKTINFDPTSRANRLVCQLFEKRFDRLLKLDVIDFGKHNTGDQRYPTAQVFFIGKIFVDSHDVQKFLHIFTLVFD